jgi:hypothetical protein
MGFIGSSRTRHYYRGEEGPYMSPAVVTSGSDNDVRIGLHQGGLGEARRYAAIRAGQRRNWMQNGRSRVYAHLKACNSNSTQAAAVRVASGTPSRKQALM